MRAVILVGEVHTLDVKEPKMNDKLPLLPIREREGRFAKGRPATRGEVQVRERHGIWEVRIDDRFYGDYHQKEHALAAAALVKLSTR